MPPGTQQVMTQLFCWHCGEAMTEDNSSAVTEHMCYDCVDDRIVWCDMCGDVGTHDHSMAYRAARHNMQHGTSIPTIAMMYCEDAGEWRCDGCSYGCECGEVYAYEDNRDTCCNDDHQAVHSYGFRPAFLYYSAGIADGVERAATWSWHSKRGELYMGLEIEVEKAYDWAPEFLLKANENDPSDPRFVYLKTDGSLDSTGIEIVTMPATLEAFMEMYPLPAVQWLRSMGARAWHRERCGMHVHLSRSAFTPSHLYKFIKFQSENAPACIAFAGRESTQWASWSNNQMEEIKTKPSLAAKHRGGYADWCNRYSAINLANRDTVELRYFRPNLNDDGAYRVVQFVQGLYDYTKQLSYRDVVTRNWGFEPFMSMMSQDEKYQHAYNYMLQNDIAFTVR